MNRILQNASSFEKYINELSDRINNSYKDNGKILAAFLADFNEDVNNETLLNDYFESLGTDEFYILNSSREVVYQNKQADEIDFADRYYDMLFDFKRSNAEYIFDDYGNSVSSANDETTILYAYKSGDYSVVVKSDKDSIENYEDDVNKWRTLLYDTRVDDKSFISVVSKENGEVIYSEDEQFAGNTIDIENTKDTVFTKIDGISYLVRACTTNDVDYYLYELTPVKSLFMECLYNSYVECILFGFLIILLVAYIVFLREDELDSNSEFEFLGKYFLGTQVKRFVAFSSFLAIMIIIVLIGILDLSQITEKSALIKYEAQDCIDPIEQYLSSKEDISNDGNTIYYKYCKMLKAFIENHNGYEDKKGLCKINSMTIGYLMDLESITYFDADGKTIITSSSLDNLCILDNKDSSLYELKNVLVGKENIKVNPDTDLMQDNCMIYAISNRDENDYANGIFLVVLKNNSTSQMLEKYDEEVVGTLFSLMDIDVDSTLFVVDTDGMIILHPDESIVGKTLEDIGYTNEIISDDYDTIINIDGKECYVYAATNSSETFYTIITKPIKWSSERIIYRIIAVLIQFIILMLFMIFDGLGSKYHFESREAKVKDADDWQNTKITWSDLNASKKTRILLKCSIFIFTLFIIYVYFVTVNNVTEITGFSYIVAEKWSKGFNFFSVWMNLCLLCVIYSVIQILCGLMKVCTEFFGKESITAFHVFSSVIRYAGIILSFCLCAKNFGFDTKTILASIGIVGFGLTFGAQDMIKDMIAGMFILFEGNYKVGDMLLIDGNWFWVDSIGVRTTKFSAWGQVMVINNSKMTSVINIQNASACVDCDVTIGNEYDINDIITILDANLPRLKERFSSDISTPAYKGIQHLYACGTTIRIRAYCPPLKQGWVGRSLRAEVKRIFEEYKIRIIPEEYLIINTEIDKKSAAGEISENARNLKEAAQQIINDK